MSDGPRVVLVVAGIDPSGGAGLIADVATVAGRGLHAAAVPTALTLQDSARVHAVSPVDAGWIARELALLAADFAGRIGAIKVGMLASASVAAAVARGVRTLVVEGVPLVLDPVLRATVGEPLLAGDVEAALAPLLPLATLITPNRDEAAALTGLAVDDADGQRAAASALRARGLRAVLIKGGHLAGDRVSDLFDAGDGGEPIWLSAPRVAGAAPHGTGCALATEIACALAIGTPLRAAVAVAHARLAHRLAAARTVGKGRPVLPPT